MPASALRRHSEHAQGLRSRDMVAVITAVLAGSAIGLLTAVASEQSLAAALVPGGMVALAVLAVMMRLQQSAWEQAASAPVSFGADDTGSVRR